MSDKAKVGSVVAPNLVEKPLPKPEHWSDYLLADHGSPDTMVEWALTQTDGASAWGSCVRGGWLIQLLDRIPMVRCSPIHKSLVGALCACIRVAVLYTGEHRNDVISCLVELEEWLTHSEAVQERHVINATSALVEYRTDDRFRENRRTSLSFIVSSVLAAHRSLLNGAGVNGAARDSVSMAAACITRAQVGISYTVAEWDEAQARNLALLADLIRSVVPCPFRLPCPDGVPEPGPTGPSGATGPVGMSGATGPWGKNDPWGPTGPTGPWSEEYGFHPSYPGLKVAT